MKLQQPGTFDAEARDWAIPRYQQSFPVHIHTPGRPYPPGKYVKEAWGEIQYEKVLADLTREMAWRRAKGVSNTPTRSVSRTRKYAEDSRCPDCKERPLQVRGKCRPCYSKEYHRVWYQVKKKNIFATP